MSERQKQHQGRSAGDESSNERNRRQASKRDRNNNDERMESSAPAREIERLVEDDRLKRIDSNR